MGKGPLYITAGMNRDQCIGGALMMSFLSDIFTISGKESFTTAEVVTILDLIGKRELPEGMMDLVKDAADGLNPRSLRQERRERNGWAQTQRCPHPCDSCKDFERKI